ncbi:MAG: hypothetical protein RL322_2747 [Pseudomonadota bacterium]|jgi:formate dehydrogenase subunit delta
METMKLIQMANQIGAFFAAWPERGEAREGIAHHLRRFWEPRMRRALLQTLGTPQAELLSPLVREALEQHVDTLMPVADR